MVSTELFISLSMIVSTKLLTSPKVDSTALMLFSTKVVELLDELASDPDDKHVPPSVRNSYRCEKVFVKIMVMVINDPTPHVNSFSQFPTHLICFNIECGTCD